MSWMLMGLEGPALCMVIARLEDPTVHLAAFGGIVFPVALLVEAPIIMMLAASTALSRDRDSYRRLLRFTTQCGVILTVIHFLIAFTPLYDLLVEHLLGSPEETREPGRLGLRIMTLWTWAIADRRFHQGVLIRFGRSRVVGLTTFLRLLTTGSVLVAGYAIGSLPGIAVASTALTLGVCGEMLYVRWAVRPILRGELSEEKSTGETLTLRKLLAFYVPLALTPLLTLTTNAIGSAAMGRMPLSLESLASWTVVIFLIFLSRTPGMAFNEVVIRHAGDEGGRLQLRRLATRIALGAVFLLVLLTATPLSTLWFTHVVPLEPGLFGLARTGLWLGVLLPILTVIHSFYTGYLVHEHKTRAVTESVAMFLLVTCTVLGVGVLTQRWAGLPVTLIAITSGAIAQAGWLRLRSSTGE
jgi:hypothetical protein